MSASVIIEANKQKRSTIQVDGITTKEVESLKSSVGKLDMKNVNNTVSDSQIKFANTLKSLTILRDNEVNRLKNLNTLNSVYLKELEELTDSVTLMREFDIEKQRYDLNYGRIESKHQEQITSLKKTHIEVIDKLEVKKEDLLQAVKTIESDAKTKYEEKVKEINYTHTLNIQLAKDEYVKALSEIEIYHRKAKRENDKVCKDLESRISVLKDDYDKAVEYNANYEELKNKEVGKRVTFSKNSLKVEHEDELLSIKDTHTTNLKIADDSITEYKNILDSKQAEIVKLEKQLKTAEDNFNTLVQQK